MGTKKQKDQTADLEQRLQEAEAQLEAAREALATARTQAITATISLRDLRYCQQQGLLTADDRGVAAAARQEQQARAAFVRADQDLMHAKESVLDLRAYLERERASEEGKRRADYVAKRHPEIVAELEEARAAYSETIHGSDDSEYGYTHRVVAARERMNRSQANFDAACAEAPTAP